MNAAMRKGYFSQLYLLGRKAEDFAVDPGYSLSYLPMTYVQS